VIGLGRDHGREAVLSAGATDFVGLDGDPRPELRGVSLIFDTIGGPVATKFAADLDDSARFISIVDPGIADSRGVRGTFFVVEPDRAAPLSSLTS
jgi:NADPH:quinone reductase-like Zn-dependent oxidoreductase